MFAAIGRPLVPRPMKPTGGVMRAASRINTHRGYAETTVPAAHTHHMPTSGRALTTVAISATLHCLTGCAIGEILGMAIGTALGFSNWGTVVLATGLAFLFGYS